jgi:hypothetical protein
VRVRAPCTTPVVRAPPDAVTTFRRRSSRHCAPTDR